MSEVAAATGTPASAPSSSPAPSSNSSAPSAPSGSVSRSAPADSRFVDKPVAENPPIAEARKEAERRKYKLKIDGLDQDEDLTDDEVSVRLQKAKGAEKRMQEAAADRKKFFAASEAIRNDPFGALKEAYGIDIEKLAEERLAAKYQEQLLPENERRELEYKRQLAERDGQLKSIKDKEEATHREAYETKLGQEMESGFLNALQTSGLPQNYETLKQMVEVAKFNLEHGIDLTPAQIASEVRDRAHAQAQHVFKNMSGEGLLKYLGADVVKEVLKLSVAKIRQPKAMSTPAVQSTEIEDRKPRQMSNSRDIAKAFRRG